MAQYMLTTSVSCQPAGGVIQAVYTFDPQGNPGQPQQYYLGLFDSAGQQLELLPISSNGATASFQPVPDGSYDVRVQADVEGVVLAQDYPVMNCAGGPALVLTSTAHTDETAAGNDGTATITASGGTAPLTATISGPTTRPSQPATAGQPSTFTGLTPGAYTLTETDSAVPPASVSGTVTIAAYTVPVPGCTDEYADNYDPAATTSDNSCTYTPRWRSAWGPTGLHVRVAATPGQQQAFIAAELRIGFRPGHPLAVTRPLGEPVALRATVGPDGFATFRLGPFLRSAIGAADGNGGYRLDLNSLTAYTSDLYVGYELRRTTGEMLEHGYALNAAVPDEQLPRPYGSLSPFFPGIPTWPGFTDYPVPYLGYDTAYGTLSDTDRAIDFEGPVLPCPTNPLPVAWLAPGGGIAFWVFSGKSMRGDAVGDGQQFREASSGELRYSYPGAAYQTYQASSGVFRGDALLLGLRTLWRSPQAWFKPEPAGPWVPIIIERGSREVGRLGVLRNELPLSFQIAMPEWAQGQ